MLRRWCVLLAMLAVTVGTALAAGPASAATGLSHGGVLGSFPWPPSGTENWSPGGPINRVGLFQQNQTQVESTNWSGYADTSGTFTSVTATWTQPAGTCSSGDQYAAFWVGLDGYSSSTVEQTGSEVDCVGKTAEYYAWYEAYPAASKDYSNTVKANDVFTATVTYLGASGRNGSEFSLSIADTTQGWSHITDVTVTGAKRSSAEVIAEAPCCTITGGILPLTNFGTVNFSGSMATPTSGSSEAIGTTALKPAAITMVDNAGRDKDTVSALTNEENFSCTWKASS